MSKLADYLKSTQADPFKAPAAPAAPKPQQPAAPAAPKPEPQQQPAPLDSPDAIRIVGSEIIASWTKIPSAATRASLKRFMRWDPIGSYWHCADVPGNRQLLERELGADFSGLEADIVSVPAAPAIVSEPALVASEPQPAEMSDSEVEERILVDGARFLIFRSQIDELREHLGIDGADLMVLAVDCLHKTRLGGN